MIGLVNGIFLVSTCDTQQGGMLCPHLVHFETLGVAYEDAS